MTVSYERLEADPIEELQKICDFAGLERERTLLEHIVGTASFDEMRIKERRTGLSNPIWPKDKDFVRRGKVGSFSDEMPASVQAAFLKEAGPTMRRLGYSWDEEA